MPPSAGSASTRRASSGFIMTSPCSWTWAGPACVLPPKDKRLQTRISNGRLEGLSSLVQAAEARARGSRSTRNPIAMIYVMHGKLPLHLHQPI